MVTDYGVLLRELAVPRLAGSVAEARVLEALEVQLTARGLAVRRLRCPLSTGAFALLGWLGAWLLVLAGSAAVFPLTDPSPDFAARVVLAGTVLALLFAGTPLRDAILERSGVRPTSGINVLATRSAEPPQVWLVAHYDAKGQPLSMLGRLVGMGLAATGWVAMVVLAVLHRAGMVAPHAVWVAAAVTAGVGALALLAVSRLRDSPGAVDNASGILTVLGVLDALPPDGRIGVICTDGEEYGLAGARALARERPELFRRSAVVNFDGIDDRGPTIAFVHRPGPLTDALAERLGARRWRRLPVLVDGMVLGRVARECVTVMRGDWRTARIVHTPEDTAERLTLAGVRQVGDAVAAVLRERRA